MPERAACESCHRDVAVEDLVTDDDGRLLCEPCQVEIAKAEDRRDSIDAALGALRSVAGDGLLWVGLTMPPGGPIGISIRYHRVNELGPAASIDAHGGPATVAQVMRELATVIANLPAPVPDGGT